VAIQVTGEVLEAAQWPQGDARDPLGVWGCRVAATGDATGSSIKAFIQVPAERRRGHIYTCYSAQSGVTLAPAAETSTLIRIRLLTNWPDIDVLEGVQGYSTNQSVGVAKPLTAFFPVQGPLQNLVSPNDRFVLLFDPSNVDKDNGMNIAEIERDANVDTNVYTFEAYGYYWDRAVLDAPGGPRHPGSS